MKKKESSKLVKELGLIDMTPKEKKEWEDIYKLRLERIERLYGGKRYGYQK